MAEINANFVVQPFGITVTPDAPGISVTATPTNLNVYSLGYAQPSGNVGELQFNLNGQVLGGAANTLASNGNVRFTNISNLKIDGGANAYFLQTDGAGNLTWAQGTANVSGNGTAAGANTQIQISDGTGNFTSGAGFTFDNATNLFSTPGNVFIAGNANIVGNIANANITNALVGNTANFSGNIAANNFAGNAGNFAGNVSANYFIGNGSQLTGIDPTQIQNGTANVRTFLNSNVTISAAGNANVVVVEGNAVTINGDQLFNGNAAWGAQNIQANYINANYVVGTLVTAQQPNITSVGTLGNLSVTGNIVSGNVYANSGTIGANLFTGNLLTGTLTTNAQPNITSLGTLSNLSVSGNINANIITANIINGNITGSLANGNSNIAIPTANGNVNISVTGNSNVVAVTGNAMYVNGQIHATQFVSNVIGNTPPFIVSASGLVSNLNADSLQGYQPSFTANAPTSVVLRDANGEIRVSTANANLVLANFITGTLTTNAQPNITDVGTLSNLSVTGNTVSGNVYANSGTIGANLLIGNGVNSSSFFYFSEQIELFASNLKFKTSATDRLILNSTAANFTVPIITNGNITANNANITNNVVANNANITNNVVANNANITNNVVANNASFTEWANANNITVTANINAGNVKTDNLLYANGTPWNFTVGGSNTQIQYNNNNAFAGSNAFTFNNITNTVTISNNLIANNFIPINNTIIFGNTATSNAIFGIAIGFNSNASQTSNTSPGAIAIGANTLSSNNGIVIGQNSKATFNSIIIGSNSNSVSHGDYTVAIGHNAVGSAGQQNYAIAIGANAISGNIQPNNTITLNATGNGISHISGASNRFYVKPVRDNGNVFHNLLNYDGTTGEIYYGVLQSGTAGNIVFYNQSDGKLTFGIASNINNGNSNVTVTANSNVNIGVAGTANALQITSGNSILESSKAASAAVDTTISHKIPIVLNGVTYYIALTTSV